MNKLLAKVWKSPLGPDIEHDQKLLINTLNAHTFNTSRDDADFFNALMKSDILLPDGIAIAMAIRVLTGLRIEKTSGADLFRREMERLDSIGGSCFFLGSSVKVLGLIELRARREYSNVRTSSFSPLFKPEFSHEENEVMIEAVNSFVPDVLFIGMTAPKQEKWAAAHFEELNAKHVCSIGAVFDFYAGTVKRAPQWMIDIWLEWFYRLIREPGRMWRRYLIGNTRFLWWLFKEKLQGKTSI